MPGRDVGHAGGGEKFENAMVPSTGGRLARRRCVRNAIAGVSVRIVMAGVGLRSLASSSRTHIGIRVTPPDRSRRRRSRREVSVEPVAHEAHDERILFREHEVVDAGDQVQVSGLARAHEQVDRLLGRGDGVVRGV